MIYTPALVCCMLSDSGELEEILLAVEDCWLAGAGAELATGSPIAWQSVFRIREKILRIRILAKNNIPDPDPV